MWWGDKSYGFSVRLLIFVAVLSIAFITNVSAFEITGPTIINESGTYYVMNDFTCGDYCINVQEPNVIIEGNSHTLKSATHGIDSTQANFTLKNISLDFAPLSLGGKRESCIQYFS